MGTARVLRGGGRTGRYREKLNRHRVFSDERISFFDQLSEVAAVSAWCGGPM
jgi:hypothetical protein